MNIIKRLWLSIIVTLIFFAPLPSNAMTAAEQKNMLDQLDQLDQLDHMDFLELEEKANACIRARDFDCAEKKIAKAARSAGNSKDKTALGYLKQRLAAERTVMSEERAEARRREKLAEEREEARRREERAEEERQAKRENAKAYADILNNMQKDMSDFTANMAEENKKTQRLYDQAVNEKREQQARAQREADERAAEQYEARRQKAAQERAALDRQISERRAAESRQQAQQTYAGNAPQSRTPSRQELQAQLNAKQAERNAQEEQLQQQAQQQNRERAQQQARERAQRGSAGTGVASQYGAPVETGSAAAGAGGGNGSQRKKEKLGPEQLEAVAVCWQSTKKKDIWWCDGPIQITLTGESLESNLGYAGCSNYRATDGDRTITLRSGSTVTARVFLCGWGIWTDYDMVKKYGITVQRNKYQCVNGPKTHCKENYQLVE